MKITAISFAAIVLFTGSFVACVSTAPTKDIFEIAEVDTEPDALVRIAPIYPPELKKQRFTGTVNVQVDVDEAGNMTNLKILNSAHPDFTAAVLKAIPQWKYNPGIKDGVPVKTRIHLPMKFVLRDAQKKE